MANQNGQQPIYSPRRCIVAVHPVQTHQCRNVQAEVSTLVTLKAYEVYCHVFAPQDELIKDGCRGGFGVGELIAFLYAASFQKSEWKKRFDEAIHDMKGL
jgi:hypothetical protein